MSLFLLNPLTPTTWSRLLHGYYGLQNYAMRFWIDHLLLSLESDGKIDSDLSSAIKRILPFRREPHSTEFASQMQNEELTAPISARLSNITSTPEVRHLMQELLVFQAVLLSEEQLGKSVECKIPTAPRWASLLTGHQCLKHIRPSTIQHFVLRLCNVIKT